MERFSRVVKRYGEQGAHKKEVISTIYNSFGEEVVLSMLSFFQNETSMMKELPHGDCAMVMDILEIVSGRGILFISLS